MKIWNPVAFFISLQMSFIMAFIFGIPMGMPFWVLIVVWPIRWAVAYFFANFICNPLGFKLAVKVFDYKPTEKTGIFSPVPFFISLQMSFIVPLIFGVTTMLPTNIFFLTWPVRWLTAYCLINFFVRQISFKLAVKVFKFNPEAE